jgi:ketosteroid isomerase-like protein
MDGEAEPPNKLTGGEIRRRLDEITRCRLSGQFDRMLRHFAPDVIVHYNCSQVGLFSPGVLRGRAAFLANMQRTDENYQALDGEIIDILVENGNSALRWSTYWRHRGTGRVYTVDMAYFLKWRGEVIVELHEFLDYPGPSAVGCAALSSFEDMLHPPGPGLDREEIVARVNELANFDPSQGPDIGLIRKYYSPDIVCEFIGHRARIPYAGRHVGVQAVINIVRGINVDFEQLLNSLSDILVDGGRFACRRTVQWRHRGTGRRGVVELAEFVKFEDGLIVELIEYRDSVTILEMQGGLEVW